MLSRRFVGVLGQGSLLEREGGAAAILRRLGAAVRTLDLRRNPIELTRSDDTPGVRPRALVFEALDRPDLAVQALRSARKDSYFDNVGALIAVTVEQIAHVHPSSGFDDFVRYPCTPAELYGRIRALEWRHSELVPEVRRRFGRLILDRAGRDVFVDGARVVLTSKEFELLAYLCDRQGTALSRKHILDRIWGPHYEGSPRTVDVHVARLRAKLGRALPIKTLRRCSGHSGGYLLRTLEQTP